MSRGSKFYEDLIGQKFGYLTIEKFLGYTRKCANHNRAEFLCRCECGNAKAFILPHLKNIKNISCGCKKKQWFNSRWEGYEEISMTYWSQCRNGAEDRGLDFSISIEYAWDLFMGQHRKCALSGLVIDFKWKDRTQTASLDRIDSAKGYVEGNLQWLHKDINLIKMHLDQSYFIELCERVANHARDFHPIIPHIPIRSALV